MKHMLTTHFRTSTLQLKQNLSAATRHWHLGYKPLGFPILASHSKSPTKPLTLQNFSSRAHLISRHLSSSTHSLPFLSGRMAHPATAATGYGVRKNGAPNTLEHRIFFEKDGVPISPFHDIPLYANDQHTVLNMVVEIPRWTNAKMEVSIIKLIENLCRV